MADQTPPPDQTPSNDQPQRHRASRRQTRQQTLNVTPQPPGTTVTMPASIPTPPSLTSGSIARTGSVYGRTYAEQWGAHSQEIMQVLDAEAHENAQSGDLEASDVISIGPYTRRKFATMGILHPNDAWIIYNEADPTRQAEYRGYLKSLANYAHFGGVRADAINVVTDYIMASPLRDPRVTRDEIEANIRSAPAVPPFEWVRREDLKTYLKFFGLGEGQPIKLTFQPPGAGHTVDIAEDEIEDEAGVTPLISGRTREVTMPDQRDRFAYTAVLNTAYATGVEDIMQKQTPQPQSLAQGFAAFAKAKNIKKYFGHASDDIPANEYPQLRDMIVGMMDEASRARFAAAYPALMTDVDDVPTPPAGFENSLQFDREAFGLKPHDGYMRRKLLTSKAFRIGKTRNPAIASLASMLPPNAPTPATGFYMLSPLQTGSNIRSSIYTTIRDQPSLDALIKAVGINPKVGFLPLGYEYANLDFAQQFIEYNIYAQLPPEKTNRNVADRIRFDTQANQFVLTPHPTFDKYAATTVWITPSHHRASFDTIASVGKYGGTLCNTDGYTYPLASALNHSLLQGMTRVRDFVQEQGTTRNRPQTPAIAEALNHLSAAITAFETASQTTSRSIGAPNTIYRKPTPSCQFIAINEAYNNDSISWQIPIPAATPVGKRLQKVREECIRAMPNESDACLSQRIQLTQNSTANYYQSQGTGRYPKSLLGLHVLRNVVTPIQHVERRALLDKALEIVLGDVTGIYLDYPNASRHGILESAKLGMKLPLDLHVWAFAHQMRNSQQTAYTITPSILHADNDHADE